VASGWVMVSCRAARPIAPLTERYVGEDETRIHKILPIRPEASYRNP